METEKKDDNGDTFTYSNYSERLNERASLVESLESLTLDDSCSYSIVLTKDIVHEILLEYLPVFEENHNYYHFWECLAIVIAIGNRRAYAPNNLV